MMRIAEEVSRRKSFAIISHPDAGKSTLTEKLLLFGGAIRLAGAVKGQKSARHTTSDWMALEQQRGISVSSSVMQFYYRDHVINLLDTPGHSDFSEDTYRTLSAVDSALMVIDAAKGVEARTIKLMNVCRLRKIPIMTFINKMDRDSGEPIALLDEIEAAFDIQCAPLTWPIDSGRNFRGLYDIQTDQVHYLWLNDSGQQRREMLIQGLRNPVLDDALGPLAATFREEIDLVCGASHSFDQAAYNDGSLTPVLFGSAIWNVGVKGLLDRFIDYAPAPQPRHTEQRQVTATENTFSGFVFKIQANMDPQHRDRIAFVRITSGCYQPGLRVHQVRTGKELQLNHAMTFMANERDRVEEAFAGDIIGIHNHGTIAIGDTFTEGEALKFSGIPSFAPELFRRIILNNPLRMKALHKGLDQLSEEGATHVFRPLSSNDLILGAIGTLQFDVITWRLKNEYRVDSRYEPLPIQAARWVCSDDAEALALFQQKNHSQLAFDARHRLTYLAPSLVNLNLTMERWPKLQFIATQEI